MSDLTSDEAIAALAVRLDELTDLFRRRLLDDKDKKRAFDSLYERLERAERAAEGELVLPLLRQLLLVVDRLDGYQGDEPLVSSVHEELLEILRRSGVEPLADAERVDPACHEVVEVTPHADEGAIVGQVRRGWAMGGRLLRPAQVVVGCPSVAGVADS
jgi:molecular chaperone GrpE